MVCWMAREMALKKVDVLVSSKVWPMVHEKGSKKAFFLACLMGYAMANPMDSSMAS